jgi:hypothetical protein
MSKFNFNLQEKGSKHAFSIFLIVLFIIFLVLSIVFLSKKDNYIKIKADIKNINCYEVRTKHTSNRGVVTYSYKYNCNINVTYNIKDKKYENNIKTNSSTDYRKDKTIEISYDPNNPMNIRLPITISKVAGIIFSVLAFLIFCVSIANLK